MRKYTRNQKCVWIAFICYLGLLLYLVFFAESFGRGGGRLGDQYAYNLELLKEIKRFYINRDVLGFKAVAVNLLGNVVAFVPFAFMLPIVSRRTRGLLKTVFLTFLLSLCIECIQLVTRVGSFDVDDLLLNSIGGLCGYILYRIVQGIRVRRKLRAGKENE